MRFKRLIIKFYNKINVPSNDAQRMGLCSPFGGKSVHVNFVNKILKKIHKRISCVPSVKEEKTFGV
jgi:hypothetical protein